ncbi:nucleoside hydrolase [Flexivirga endophytica]|uniref:Nucleoside hydrolase n=2 Tax=Flexivirga endophytica TaxID=1849103 RepID=A0A916WPJ2_9MICO|nr:nucleoside hydrolase [Flexivirga endophytica]GHB71047.1 nucleoside hydrolase [Flexivirga endophytica]
MDVDTGVDDACALLLAALHPEIELRAVTCVGGNTDVAQVTRNTLAVLEIAGREDVPVGRGAERPLIERAVHARHVHGDDGMGDLDWVHTDRQPDPRHAVELLRDVLGSAPEPVTLVPTAPMTNVALLARTYPDALRGVGRIVFMGGAAQRGNATASAEFNVFHDPEATAIVLDVAAERGIPVTMYGLDVFYEPKVSRAEARQLVSSGTDATRLAGELVEFQCERFGSDEATIGDAGAVCAVIDPEGIGTTELPVRVELAGTWSRGRTIVDVRDWSGDLDHDPHGRADAMIDVALEIDGRRYADLWLDTIGGTPRGAIS